MARRQVAKPPFGAPLALRLCIRCESEFELTRKDRKFCTSSCRSRHGQDKARRESPVNSSSSKAKLRENMELFNRVLALTEQYYKTPKPERLGYLRDLVAIARAGETKTRAVLANRYLVYIKDPKLKSMIRRHGFPEPIGRIVDKYCRHFWGASGREVVIGFAPDPPTGEIIADGSDSTHQRARGSGRKTSSPV